MRHYGNRLILIGGGGEFYNGGGGDAHLRPSCRIIRRVTVLSFQQTSLKLDKNKLDPL